MNMQVLYVELYVSFFLAIIIYVLYELFNVVGEKEQSEADQAPVPRPRDHKWFATAGMIALGVGLLAFCVSAVLMGKGVVYSGDSSLLAVSLVTGLLNPFFFVGVPLGIYWLSRGKQPAVVEKKKGRR
jgi:hypothetical protein